MSDDVNPYNAGSRVVPAATSPAGEDSLEVGFETQVEDKIAALIAGESFRRSLRQQNSRANIWLMIGIAIGGGLLAMGTVKQMPRDFFKLVVVLAGAPLAVGVWLRFAGPGSLRRRFAAAVIALYSDPRDRRLSDWTRLSIGPAGIRQSAEHFELLLRWVAVDRIEVVDELLLFHLIGVETLFAPKRAFQNDAHLQIFLDAARRFHRGGLGGGSETPFDRTP
jgi:hypothetical protein